MLGSYTATQAAERGWDVWATYSAHEVELPGVSMIQLDLSDLDRTVGAVERIRPDAIIHTAANAKPDDCELHKDRAFSANVTSAQNIFSAAEGVGAHIVHVSTDLVFNGEDNPYKTNDTPGPVNYYALTKLAAEVALFASSTTWAIARTSIIFGPRKFPFLASFSDNVIDSLKAGKTVNAFEDQVRAPIPAWNLADVLLEIADRRLTGIYHAVCPESCTRLAFAQKLAEVFDLDASLLNPTAMDDVQTPARRPKMLVLDTLSTQAALNTRLLSYEEGILSLPSHQDGGNGQ